MGLFSDKNDEYVKLDRDEGRRATDYEFKAKLNHKEMKEAGMKLVKDIDEWDGMELAENNPRLLALVVTIMAEMERLEDAGQKTRAYARKLGRLDAKEMKAIDTMVNKSQMAELAHMINSYATGKFIID